MTNIYRIIPLLLFLGACGPQEEQEHWIADHVSQRERTITDGQPYSGYPSVGLMKAQVGGAIAMCTATLVGKRTVLLAAHCIKPGSPHNFTLHTGQYQVSQAIRHSSYNASTIENDIGLLILSKEPPITPSVVSQTAPHSGLKITIIGYGITSSYRKDSGVKRMAVNNVATVYSTRFTFNGTGNGIGNTCDGDSGGPAFAILSGKEVQVGVTSAGAKPCGKTGIDTRVDAFYSWLKTTSNGDLWQGKPDTQKPQVSFAAPQNGAAVGENFSVTVTASDDRGVASVELFVDGQSKGKRSAPPYQYQVAAPGGAHTLRAVARDSAGNQGTAQIVVTVVPPKAFGAPCAFHLECRSGICASDPLWQKSICSQWCDPQNNNCPNSLPCKPAGIGLFVCGLNQDAADDLDVTGGCSITASAQRDQPSPLGPALLMLILAAGLLRRRR